MASGSVKSFYRQRKSGGISKLKPSPSISSKQKASPSCAAVLASIVRDEQDKFEEDVLRQFDLNTSYGPCVGMSRLDLGMNPPGDVESLLRIGKVYLDHFVQHLAANSALTHRLTV